MSALSVRALLIAFACTVAATAAAPVPPTIDGVIAPGEWASARREPLVGGGELLLLRAGTDLYVAVVGAGTGFPSLCVGDGAKVEVLHASAALGTVVYTRGRTPGGAAAGSAGSAAAGASAEKGQWTRGAPFDWRVRETADGKPAPKAQRDAFFAQYRWLSTASSAGAPTREFRIPLDRGRQWLGVTFLATDSMTVAHWPATMTDDCRSPELLRGAAPDALSLNPASWHRIE